jgi:hypothetical protein
MKHIANRNASKAERSTQIQKLVTSLAILHTDRAQQKIFADIRAVEELKVASLIRKHEHGIT